MNRFLEEVCTLEWHEHHDRGRPVEESCEELALAHPDQADLIRAWGRRSAEMVSGPIEGSVAILRELLEAGVRCYALTNMERETYPQRTERFGFMSWFDGSVVSGFEGVAKPDSEIFELLLTRFGLRAQTTLLIDDSAANVEGARAVGMPALRFTTPEDLRAELVGMGLLRPNSGC